jgi:DNA-binding transcriptional regulator YiaG
MAKLESTIKAEIQRLAKREVRSKFLPLRREVWGMRLKLSWLLKSFTKLDRWAKEQARQHEKEKPKLEAAPEEVKASRLTPDRIRNLRKKLGVSQRELSVLTGVSLGAVAMWEKGKFKPKGEKKATLVALRKIRKRDVKKLLAEKAGPKVQAKGKKPEVNTEKKPGKKVMGKKTK